VRDHDRSQDQTHHEQCQRLQSIKKVHGESPS
jgi:hypothetical protein